MKSSSRYASIGGLQMDRKNLVAISEKDAVLTKKKPYTRPRLKTFGAVSELTSGSFGSCDDGHNTKHQRVGNSCTP
jgi:hypothetical protein